MRRLAPACALLVLALLNAASPAAASGQPHAKKAAAVHSSARTVKHASATRAAARHEAVRHAARARGKLRHHPVRRHGVKTAAAQRGNRHSLVRTLPGAQRSSVIDATTTSVAIRSVRHAAHATTSRNPARANPAPPVTLPHAVPPGAPHLVPPSVRTLLGDVPGLVVFSGRSGWLYGGSALFASLLILVGLVGWRPSRRSRRENGQASR